MLHEVYRPKEWTDVIGQGKVTAFLARLEQSGELAGKAVFLVGKSGQGKSSIARIIASKVSNPVYTAEYDAGELTPAVLRGIEDDLRYSPLDCTARCFIVNEAHGLRKDSARILLRLLEAPLLSPTVVWVFTTTVSGQMQFEEAGIDSAPLLSRCLCLKLAERGIGEAAGAHLQRIAQENNLDGRPVEDYVKLFYSCQSNMRAAIGRIEAGEMLP